MKLIWYFDFISPFAYLQHSLFNRLPDNAEVVYKPILFVGLLNHWDNIGPAEIPPKRIFTYQHCHWRAGKLRVPFKMPPAHPFNSLNPLRLALAAGCQRDVIQLIFDIIWKYGLAFDSPEAQERLRQQSSISDIIQLTSQPEIKNQLRLNTEEAAKNAVFGVPTFRVAEQNFWGLDATDMLLDYLQNPAKFSTSEVNRINQLPEGVQRTR